MIKGEVQREESKIKLLMNFLKRSQSQIFAFSKKFVNTRKTPFNNLLHLQGLRAPALKANPTKKINGAILLPLLMTYAGYTTYKAYCIEDDVLKAAKNRIDDGKKISEILYTNL